MDEDLVDKIEKYMEKNGPQKSLSYYAFTATPKKKKQYVCLELKYQKKIINYFTFTL